MEELENKFILHVILKIRTENKIKKVLFLAKLIKLKTHTDTRGSLTVLQDEVPFSIKRMYYIYNLDPNEIRGGHRHHKNVQVLMCIRGECIISVNNGKEKNNYHLNQSDQCLIIYPEDWHTMHSFKDDAILLIATSEKYDPNDYIDEEYP